MSVAAMLSRFGVASLFVCLFVGCGEAGNQVSGAVTFDGKPVPAGKVYFIPDESKGNSGAPGYANIVDGKYDTSAAGGRGAPPGAVKIVVEGNDPSAVPAGSSPDVITKPLFAGYETTADIAEGETTHDIDVPLEAGKPKKFIDAPMNVGP